MLVSYLTKEYEMKTISYKQIVNDGVISASCVRLNGGGLNRVMLVTLTDKYVLSINPISYIFNARGELDPIMITDLPTEKLQQLENTGEAYFNGVGNVKYDIYTAQIHEKLGRKLVINGEDY